MKNEGGQMKSEGAKMKTEQKPTGARVIVGARDAGKADYLITITVPLRWNGRL